MTNADENSFEVFRCNTYFKEKKQNKSSQPYQEVF